jgi:hypothetical protein
LLILGSQESAAAVKAVIGELAALKQKPIKMINELSDIGEGFEHIAAVAGGRKSHRESEKVSRSEYVSYEALIDEAGVTCSNDASA